MMGQASCRGFVIIRFPQLFPADLYHLYTFSQCLSSIHISTSLQCTNISCSEPITITVDTFRMSLIRIAFVLFVFCPHRIERVVFSALEAFALFTIPLCVLAYHSHAHKQMQTKRPTGPNPSFAQFPFPLLPPFSDHPRVFTKAEALIVPEKKNGSECPFIPYAPTISCTYVPTIPRVPSFRSRRVLAPAPLPPPLSPPPPPPPVPASVDCIGPLNPVLTDGKYRYHVEGLIAAGGYGRVALATVEGFANPPLEVAIKVYCKDKLIANRSLLETYDLERAIMLGNKLNNCKWLVKLAGTFGDLWNRYLIMDHYPNTLSGIIFNPEFAPLPWKICRLWVEELALGLAELYNRDIVHCDLKPGNILVTSKGHLAIADFGISMMPDVILDDGKPLEECEFFSYGGTYAYQAPELLISHYGASFTCAVDMWSFGVIIFEIYTGRRLFSSDPLDVRNEVWARDIPAMVRSEIDDVLAQDLVIGLLEVDPEKRLKLKDIWKLPYFLRTNWKKVENRSISIDIDQAGLSSFSWKDSLWFERPVTPDCLPFQPS